MGAESLPLNGEEPIVAASANFRATTINNATTSTTINTGVSPIGSTYGNNYFYGYNNVPGIGFNSSYSSQIPKQLNRLNSIRHEMSWNDQSDPASAFQPSNMHLKDHKSYIAKGLNTF